MNLYVLRHAIAVDRTLWAKADADRPLTEEGLKKMKAVARGIDQLGLGIDRILTSPFRRAYDTALLTAKTLDRQKALRVTRLLSPDGDPKALVKKLALDYYSWESVLLVGHEPYLSRLMGMLVAGTPEAALELRKGGLVKLSSDSLTYGQCATLHWLLTPKLLKKLG